MATTDGPEIHWHSSLEEYFARTGEKANCLAWCHKRSEEIYSRRKTYIDLPVITLSALTGFASVAGPSLFAGQSQISSVVLGLTSLFVSVLNTTGSYFGWAKRAEGHRISSIQYSRLYRFLMVEIGLPRDERQAPDVLLKNIRDQYDRLQEISPLIPQEVISAFRSQFKDSKLGKPEELNGLDEITIYPEPNTNGTPLIHSTLYAGKATRVQSLPERNTDFSQASESAPSSTAEISIGLQPQSKDAT